ncbi:hypothetical protein [Mastigocoleus testarum]|uniref:Lipoprotein n=1 Tax=Mastigocoleus testarum BC008 TaxID=371196 RepID=A0A0V7ZPY6_9CYAN|nr:hypothetical protein [Mastigocoleus testarum]KST66529.1 hypothetical protein BC008_43160 [Mastigocoleus testarum BC008]
MFIGRKLVLVLLLSLFVGCSNSNSASEIDSTKKSIPEEIVTTTSKAETENSSLKDTLIIPGERVGSVTQQTTRDDLVKIFGESQLSDKTISGPEGIGKIPITKVNLGKGRSFTVNWDENRQKIKYINNLGPEWKTPEGINVGTSFEELQQILGEFKLTGLQWDNAGYVKLENTKLSKYQGKLSINVDAAENAYNKFPKQYQQVIGDQILSSANPNWKNLNIRVSQITVQF